MDAPQPERRVANQISPFEKHAQSVVAAIMLGILLWVGASVIKLGETVVELKVQSAATTQNMTEMKQEMTALKTQVTVAALAAANAATAAAIASLQQQQQMESRRPR